MTNINLDLFQEYVRLVKAMGLIKFHPILYKNMEREREWTHNLILEQAGKSRDDKEFALWLAEKVEEAISK